MSQRRQKRKPTFIVHIKDDHTKEVYALDKKGSLVKDPNSPTGYKVLKICEKENSEPIKTEIDVPELGEPRLDFINNNDTSFLTSLDYYFDF